MIAAQPVSGGNPRLIVGGFLSSVLLGGCWTSIGPSSTALDERGLESGLVDDRLSVQVISFTEQLDDALQLERELSYETLDPKTLLSRWTVATDDKWSTEQVALQMRDIGFLGARTTIDTPDAIIAGFYRYDSSLLMHDWLWWTNLAYTIPVAISLVGILFMPFHFHHGDAEVTIVLYDADRKAIDSLRFTAATSAGGLGAFGVQEARESLPDAVRAVTAQQAGYLLRNNYQEIWKATAELHERRLRANPHDQEAAAAACWALHERLFDYQHAREVCECFLEENPSRREDEESRGLYLAYAESCLTTGRAAEALAQLELVRKTNSGLDLRSAAVAHIIAICAAEIRGDHELAIQELSDLQARLGRDAPDGFQFEPHWSWSGALEYVRKSTDPDVERARTFLVRLLESANAITPYGSVQKRIPDLLRDLRD